jgi:hypothetical protein
MFQNKNVYIVSTEGNYEACVDLRTNSEFLLHQINLLFLTERLFTARYDVAFYIKQITFRPMRVKFTQSKLKCPYSEIRTDTSAESRDFVSLQGFESYLLRMVSKFCSVRNMFVCPQ